MARKQDQSTKTKSWGRRRRCRGAALRDGDLRRRGRPDQAACRAGALQSGQCQAAGRRVSGWSESTSSPRRTAEWRQGLDRYDEPVRHPGRRRIPGRSHRPDRLALADRAHDLSAGRPQRSARPTAGSATIWRSWTKRPAPRATTSSISPSPIASSARRSRGSAPRAW